MIVLGLGSNMGDRDAMMDDAIAALGAFVTDIIESQRYETPALLKEGAPPEWNMPFLNMAIAGQTQLSPQALIAEIKQIERRLGRQARGIWAPREIDIDILAYHDEIIATPDLTVPHEGLLARDFALKPFADVAPHWRWPLPGVHQGKTAEALVRELFP